MDGNGTGAPDPTGLIARIVAYRTSRCLHAVTALGVPALLDQGPATALALAEATGTRADLLDRVLRHLAFEGVLAVDDTGTYRATSTSALLVPGAPGSLANWVLCELQEGYWRSWDGLVDQLRTGRPAFDLVHGRPFFDWVASSQEVSALFDETMRDASHHLAGDLAGQIRVADGETVVDVGGGDGTFLAALLTSNPYAHGTLLDLPRADDPVAPELRSFVTAGRCTVQRGSFFDGVPPGDVLVLKRILHDWPDEQAGRILRGCLASLRPGGRIVVVDMVAPADAPRGKSLDVLMMVLLGGRERDLDAFTTLFADNGLRAVDRTGTDGLLTAMTLVPAGENGA